MIRIVLTILIVLASLTLRSQSFTTINQSIINTFSFAEISESNNVAIIGGVYASKSLDNGYTWNQMFLGAEGYPTLAYMYEGGAIIDANTYCLIGKDDLNFRGKIIRTTDGGATWTNVLETAINSYSYFTDIIYDGTAVIVVCSGGIYRSIDQGATWTYISVASGYMAGINYNTSTGNILANCGTAGPWKVSTDSGLTWTTISPLSSGIYYKSITNQAGNYIVTKSTSSKNWYVLDNTETTIDTISSNSSLFIGTVYEAYFMPSGALLTRDDVGYFYYVDTLTENVYYINHFLQDNGGNYVEIYDMDVDQTYGLAVGPGGALSRIDLSGTPNIYVPADFTVTNTSCPGDNMVGSADYPYVDSVQWYYDGNLISTDTVMNYVTPYTFGFHTITFTSWLNGNSISDSTTVYYSNLYPVPSYTSYLGTSNTPCFGNWVTLNVDPQGSPCTACDVVIYQDTAVFYGPTTMGSSSLDLPTSPITSQDTFYTIISYPQECGTTYDTLIDIVYMANDPVQSFTLLDYDTVVCWNDTVYFGLINTNPDNTYKFKALNDQGSYIWSTSWLPGITGDTVWFPGFSINGYNLNYQEDYLGYVNISVSYPGGGPGGCQLYQYPIDTIRFLSQTAIFYTSSQNYYKNDTVNVFNGRIRDNRLWEVNPTGPTIQNISDTIPLVVTDTIGFYDLTLTNEHIPQCISTLTKSIQIADTLPQDQDSLCWMVDSGSFADFHVTELDADGNSYEVGVIPFSAGLGTPLIPIYRIIKRDPNGNMIWERTANTTGLNDQYRGVVVEAIDFDPNGDLICAVWIHGPGIYNDGLISYVPVGGANQARTYLVKLDKNTGTMLWIKDLATLPLPMSTTNITGNSRISDVLVTNDRIHIAAGYKTRLYLITLSLSGTYINSSYFESELLAETLHIPFLPYTTNDESFAAYEYAKLDVISSGEVVCAVYYRGYPIVDGTNFPNANSPNGNTLGLLKYNENLGIYYAVKTVVSNDFTLANTYPLMVVDENDNIDIAISFGDRQEYDMVNPLPPFGYTYNLPPTEQEDLWILGSVITTDGTSVLFQVDSLFNLNWISRGSYAKITDVDVANVSNEIVIAGVTSRNVGFTSQGTSLMMGYYGDYSPEPGVNPLDWVLEDYFTEDLTDLFTMRFDDTGLPLSGRFYKVDTSLTFEFNHLYIKNNLTPCGDQTTFINYYPDSLTGGISINENGDVFIVDSMIVRKYASSCAVETCEYLNGISDTVVYCSADTSVFIPINSIYNVDSVTYILLANGNPVDTVTTVITSSGFNVPISPGSINYSLILSEPIVDTIILEEAGPIVTSYSYNQTQCLTSNQIIGGTPTNYSYLWQSSVTGSDFDYLPDSVGINIITAQVSDQYGCFIIDTLEVDVIDIIDPGFNSSYVIYCEDTLSLVYNPADYTTEDWNLNGNTCLNMFSSGNLNQGNNQLIIDLVDTNTCSQTYNIDIEYVSFINPNFSTSYMLNCNDSLIIPFAQSSYISETWTANGNSCTNFFNSGNLNGGVNSAQVTLVDTNNCEQSFNVQIIYCIAGVQNLAYLEEIEIRPNPTSGEISIILPKDKSHLKHLEVQSMDGRSIDQIDIDNEDVLNYTIKGEKGTYLIVLTTDFGRYIYKVIKI